MADVELYFYLENVNLTTPQQQILIDAIKTWGKRDQDPNPRHRNHWRIRLDNKAIIFEAWFDNNNLSILNIRQKLADLYEVALSQITGSVTSNIYGQLLSVTYNTLVRLRIGIFGGITADYYTSQTKAVQFLVDNKTSWDNI